MSNGPEIVLFVDDSPASKEAVKVLEQADIQLTVIHASGFTLPSARIGNAIYSGRWGIDFLAHGLPKRAGGETET